ncbi:hypothetical protein A9Q99_06180 [Gammaproteobacteria bacterium 45_16_T64]|nr:hypothetical protein A9Q99_06180 [Gammaproteobacteria bacterium 45_16_T64]
MVRFNRFYRLIIWSVFIVLVACETSSVQKQNPDANDYTTTESGLKYKIIKPGSGRKPTPNSWVRVHYVGQHLNGVVFDTSYVKNKPLTIPLSAVIKGWVEGLQIMEEGAEFEFIVPASLAYGYRGVSVSDPDRTILPNETLKYTIEFLNIVDNPPSRIRLN